MSKRTCDVPWCERRHSAQGYCGTHYNEWKIKGVAGKRHHNPIRLCEVDSCEEQHHARGKCTKHYREWQVNDQEERDPCKADGCDESATRREMCEKHYTRWLKHGDPSVVIIRQVSICTFEACGRAVHSDDLCEAHADQHAKGKQLAEIRSWRPNMARDAEGRKLCRDCLEWLPEDQFSRNSRNPDGIAHICKGCSRARHLIRRYGITWEQYLEILDGQGGGCAICGRQCSTGRLLAIDHDHACCPENSRSCGKCIRGLLCRACNQAIGQFEDSPTRLEAAAAYIRKHAA